MTFQNYSKAATRYYVPVCGHLCEDDMSEATIDSRSYPGHS